MSGKRSVPAIVGVIVVAAILVVAVIVTRQRVPRLPPAPPKADVLQPQNVREPAVAGLFYPKDQAELSKMLDSLLANAAPHTIDGELRGLVCPHAGYAFSGPIAAVGYRMLLGREFHNVVLLAVSHYAAFQGASVAHADGYRTPLGIVMISPMTKELATNRPFVIEPRCFVQRPDWSRHASHPEPPVGEETPETWEHSGEVQVPFLQKTLKGFTLTPVVVGEADPEQMARVLAGRIDDKTLIVASSDLSHYHPYEQAKELDTRCVQAICNLDVDQMKTQEACGKLPILTLMHLARQKGWKTKLLDSRNSGDTPGDKRGVVGYAAIAFYLPAPQQFSLEERKVLLQLARKSLREVVTSGRLPEAQSDGLTQKLTERKGCFVTLTKRGVLRGCIGHIVPQQPLHKAIMENAESAALRDPRFQPVQPDELDQIEIELSVLTVPEALAFSSPDDLLSKLRPHRDGVVLQIGNRGATYLPQVWSQIPDKVAFLNSLAEKAGCAADAWRARDTKVRIYHVESFSESEM